MNRRLRVIVDGRVQGVGFRYAAQRAALSLGLTGWVRNLPDGRVEAEFDGPLQNLQAMRDWCDQGPAFARVTDVAEEWGDTDNPHPDFRILG